MGFKITCDMCGSDVGPHVRWSVTEMVLSDVTGRLVSPRSFQPLSTAYEAVVIDICAGCRTRLGQICHAELPAVGAGKEGSNGAYR